MIFLSHTHADKPIVDEIAQRLAKTFGQDKIFYDSWSIQPGDGIIEKMNDALKSCAFFFFFVSKKSLQSNMVKIEWQNALYKSTKEKIKIIPVKIDDCMMPDVLLQTLYIDIFGHGLEASTRQMIDVISGKNTYQGDKRFHNIRANVSLDEKRLVVEFVAEAYMEPHSSYIVLTDNLKDDIEWKVIDESMFNSGFQENITLSESVVTNAIFIGRNTPTSPGFPFIVEVTSKNAKKLNFKGAMRIISRGKYESVPVIYKMIEPI